MSKINITENIGNKYEHFLYDYFSQQNVKAELVVDAELQKKGCDVIAEVRGKKTSFDCKSSTKTAKTGNLQFDIVESFNNKLRYGWFFNGELTDWLVFYTPYSGDTLVEYSINKHELQEYFEAQLSVYDLSSPKALLDALTKDGNPLYKNKAWKFAFCTADGDFHKTLLWIPNIYALAKEVNVWKRTYKFSKPVDFLSNELLDYNNAKVVESEKIR